MRVPVFDVNGKRTPEILEFDENIFGDMVREVLLKDSILMYEARQRQGTHSTKTRKDCAGSGRKLWRQKGTGRARVGPLRAPHWKGGGRVFGPHPRDYSYDMPKKAKKLAMKSAWLAKFLDKEIMVIENFPVGTAPKTKLVYKTLATMGILQQRVLVGLWDNDEVTLKSLRNIPRMSMEHISRFNPYILLANDRILLVKKAFENLIVGLGGQIKSLRREELYKKADSSKPAEGESKPPADEKK